jgi:hypothetical protein
MEPILEFRHSMEFIVLPIPIEFLSGPISVSEISRVAPMEVADDNCSVCTWTSLNLKDIKCFWAQFYNGYHALDNASINNSGSDSDSSE